MSAFKVGDIVGMLRVTSGSGRRLFCKCACGDTILVSSGALKVRVERNPLTSCRKCWKKRNRCESDAAGRTRGPHKSKEYRAWAGMKGRCNNENSQDYRLYGGRGIKVSPEWESFEQFFLDMGKAPTKNHSLDRIDFNGDYSKSNCRWATSTEQANNMRRNRKHTLLGFTGTISEISRKFKVKVKGDTIRWRIKSGWSIEDSFLKPTSARPNYSYSFPYRKEKPHGL
jgi:hypothetical protein